MKLPQFSLTPTFRWVTRPLDDLSGRIVKLAVHQHHELGRRGAERSATSTQLKLGVNEKRADASIGFILSLDSLTVLKLQQHYFRTLPKIATIQAYKEHYDEEVQ